MTRNDARIAVRVAAMPVGLLFMLSMSLSQTGWFAVAVTSAAFLAYIALALDERLEGF